MTKKSYTVPCPSGFRDNVLALADEKQVNAGDLARSVMLVVPKNIINSYPDPGEPDSGDREQIVLKSGPSKGRPWKRKPRLQVRMTPGLDAPFIRKSLALALAQSSGDIKVDVQKPKDVTDKKKIDELAEEIERQKAIISVLSFSPLPQGITNKREALHVLGFAPGDNPGPRAVKARFRVLATIHHPDSPYGSTRRMSQLNMAMDFLKNTA